MRRIILASRSKARKRLLKMIGIKFKTAAADIKENRIIKTSCSGLVAANALKKAVAVAGRFDSGIIIAADTVVLSGKKIIGKPRSIKEAARTLKALSRRPQWVYTGIAVVDIDNNKTYTACEKTKIYMAQLTDNEIKEYFKIVSPLDKAGGFDIQGVGARFVERIEGCFYNVVGLPLAKLVKILEKTSS